MRQPDTIAFAGDWHGNTNWAESTIRFTAEDGVSHIVHTGDYGYRYSSTFVATVERALAATSQMLYFVDGNHDEHDWIWSHDLDEDGFYIISEHVRAIPRAHRWQWWGLKWMGLGGATSVDRQWRRPMLEWWPTEVITDDQLELASAGGPVDVMIAHDCPSGVPIPGISYASGLQRGFPAEDLHVADWHRERLRVLVDQIEPALYVHGHYHEDYTATVDGCRYVGLHMDATDYDKNIWVVNSVFDLMTGEQYVERAN